MKIFVIIYIQFLILFHNFYVFFFKIASKQKSGVVNFCRVMTWSTNHLIDRGEDHLFVVLIFRQQVGQKEEVKERLHLVKMSNLCTDQYKRKIQNITKKIITLLLYFFFVHWLRFHSSYLFLPWFSTVFGTWVIPKS